MGSRLSKSPNSACESSAVTRLVTTVFSLSFDPKAHLQTMGRTVVFRWWEGCYLTARILSRRIEFPTSR